MSACFSSTSVCAIADDDDKSQSSAIGAVTTRSDSTTIDMDLKAQQLSGIKTQVLETVQQKPELTVYGTVLSLEPLLQLRQQYLATQAQQDSAKAKYTEAHLNLTRTKDLHNQEIVSTRRLQEQQAQWQSDKANLAASTYQQKSILAASRLEWGDILTNWFILRHNKAAEAFLNQDAQLLQITMPVNTRLNPEIRDIYFDEHGQRHTAIKATLIAASPKIDPISQTERYFFKAEGRLLAFGTHITAWIAEDAQQISGVSIPRSALVWHLGQAFVFIKIDNNHFNRLTLPEFTSDDHGYFVTGKLQPGQEIVTTGAQILLSQQLKALIPKEDKD